MSQNEDFDDALERIKVLEIENTETKLRIESVENWLIKLDDKIKDVSVRADTSGDPKCTEHVENNMKALRSEFAVLKETVAFTATSQPKSLKTKTCNDCGEVFSRNYELENHMVHIHGSEKTHKCDICGKTFYLKLRLNKHMSIHQVDDQN